jgi:hypothetical protein
MLVTGERQTSPKSRTLVFVSAAGTALDAHNVRRSFRRVVARAGLDPASARKRVSHSATYRTSDDDCDLSGRPS